ncbi:MAG: hypothetical protein JNL11_19470 [Bdellovibrionaceae bacterium]|nr:hypothetical protein [Pseudobdellovibrionaceae bacterium]
MSSGANQRAAREVQNESAKLLTHQNKRLEKLSDMVSALSKRIDQQYAETKEREKVDDKRNEENTCFTRIAAWSAVAGIIVAILSTVIGTWIQIALK